MVYGFTRNRETYNFVIHWEFILKIGKILILHINNKSYITIFLYQNFDNRNSINLELSL